MRMNMTKKKKTDVFSFGILLSHMFNGRLPKYTMKDKMNQKAFPLPSPSESISEFCINLIARCISFDPKTRPLFDEIFFFIILDEKKKKKVI